MNQDSLNYTHYFCNKSLWSNGFNRDIWSFWKDSVGIFNTSVRDRMKGKKFEVRPYSNHRKVIDNDELSTKTKTK